VTEPDDTIIDDVFHCNRWEGMLADAAPGEELELVRVRRMVCAGAAVPDVARHGRHWLSSFLDYCERGGIGSLRARSDGSYTLVLADPLPSRSEAWERVAATWPPA
jgi:hypothetical protein